MNLGKRIYKALQERGITQSELAKRTGIDRVSINRLIHGKENNPTINNLKKIASALGKSFEYFDEDYDPRKSLEPPKGYTRVPILGSAPAGNKIPSADDYIEGYVDLPIDSSSGKELYLLRVQGDSMIEANIKEGNKIIVQFNKEPKNGDIVVSRVDGETTIKYFYKYDGTVVLRPANPAYKEEVYSKKNEIEIRGVVIGVLW